MLLQKQVKNSGELTEEGEVRSKHKDKAPVLRSQYWREIDDKRWMKTLIVQNQKPFQSHISNTHIKKPAWGIHLTQLLKFFMKH